MNISNYDFHDGYIIDVKQHNKNILIYMESSEISEEELKDDILLSKNKTIKGKLHINKVKKIKINENELNETFIMSYDEGNIHSFIIEGNTVNLLVSWINHSPKKYEETDFVKIEIEAADIFWENIPDLVNPYW